MRLLWGERSGVESRVEKSKVEVERLQCRASFPRAQHGLLLDSGPGLPHLPLNVSRLKVFVPAAIHVVTAPEASLISMIELVFESGLGLDGSGKAPGLWSLIGVI